MDKLKEEASYYTVIPGFIRFDKKLSPFSKLLYGEIAAKCNLKGHCWATNDFFAEIYGCDVRSIQRYLKELQEQQHIIIEYKTTEKGTARHLYLANQGMAFSSPPTTTTVSPPHDKAVTHIKTIEETNSLHINGATIYEPIQPVLTDEEKVFVGFQKWIGDNAAKILKMKEPVTAKQLTKLLSNYTREQVKDIFLQMHNKVDLLKKYEVAYTTANNWLKRNYKTPPASKDLFSQPGSAPLKTL